MQHLTLRYLVDFGRVDSSLTLNMVGHTMTKACKVTLLIVDIYDIGVE